MNEVKRKERPTYRAWLAELAPGRFAEDGTVIYVHPLGDPMPPIRCTVTPPCGVCWYCHEATR